MRGFRGSRAAQQFFGRHGQNHSVNQSGGFNQPHSQDNSAIVSRLPEWMKTPETKAREIEEAKQREIQAKQMQSAKKHVYDHPRVPAANHHHQLESKPASKAKPQLRLITNSEPIAKPKARAQVKAAPKAKTAAPKARATKTTSRTKSVTAAKRKSA
jgi:hypothetical protein